MISESYMKAQIDLAMKVGVNDQFQAGYVAALCWLWDQAGLKPTAQTVALYAAATAFRCPVE